MLFATFALNKTDSLSTPDLSSNTNTIILDFQTTLDTLLWNYVLHHFKIMSRIDIMALLLTESPYYAMLQLGSPIFIRLILCIEMLKYNNNLLQVFYLVKNDLHDKPFSLFSLKMF